MPPAPAPQQNESSPERRMSFGSEIALQHGIHFEAKYIGSMEMGSSRAGTRCEILAAMRRVRYEFKARNIRKRPVDLVISVDGLKVVLQRKKKKQMMFMDESKMLVMSQPMYRVFYVAHDSYDPQIFCYVARDGASNTFKCNVFKCAEQDQALAVVRTVGQAFELCNRLSQEQNRERQLLEEERAMDSTMAARHKGSVGPEGAEDLERREREKSSASPAQNSPKMGQSQRKDSGGQKRHSIFMPRRMTVDEEEEEEGGEDNGREGTESPEENLMDFSGPSTSAATRQSIVLERCPMPALVQSQPAEFGANYGQPNQQQMMPMGPQGPSASSTLAPFQGPAGPLWNIPVHPQPPQQHFPFFGQVLHPPAAANIPPSAADPSAQFQSLYSMVPPTVSLHSPLLLSPYAAFQMPPGASIPSTSSEATLLVNDLSPGNSEAQRQLVRAHLEQAQQQAQVAACQVQLLRDQLNTETTARLEAQSKTHQLLNSNRELLEQVQQLVNRLQSMESRMTEGLMNHLHTNDVRHSGGQQSPQRRASARPTTEEEAESIQEIIGQLRPRQMKPLRAGSLQGEEEKEEERERRRRPPNEVGGGDSAETDTDDDSGGAEQRSTGAAKVPPSSSSLLRRLIPSVPAAGASSSVLALGMPLLMGQQFARNYNPHHPNPSPTQQQPKRKDSHPLISQPLSYRPPNDIVQNQNPSGSSGGSGSSGKKSLRRFSLQASEFDPAELHHKQKNKPHISKGIFGKMEFKRMSFNTNPNKKSAEDKSLINVPDKEAAESGNEAPMEWPPLGERRNSRSSPEKKLSGSPGAQRRRSSASSYVGGQSAKGTK